MMSDNQYNTFFDMFDDDIIINSDDCVIPNEYVDLTLTNLWGIQFNIVELTKEGNRNINNLIKARLNILPSTFSICNINIEKGHIASTTNNITLYITTNNDVTLYDIDTLFQVICIKTDAIKTEDIFYWPGPNTEHFGIWKEHDTTHHNILFMDIIYDIITKKYFTWDDEPHSFYNIRQAYNELVSFIKCMSNNKISEAEIIYRYKPQLYISKKQNLKKSYILDTLSLNSFVSYQMRNMINDGNNKMYISDIPENLKSSITQDKLNNVINKPNRFVTTYIANNAFNDFKNDGDIFSYSDITTIVKQKYNKVMHNVLNKKPKHLPMKMAFLYNSDKSRMRIALYIGDVIYNNEVFLLFIAFLGQTKQVKKILKYMFGKKKIA